MAPSTPARPTVPPDPSHTAEIDNESSINFNAKPRRPTKDGPSTHQAYLKPAQANGKSQVADDKQLSLQGFITNHYAKIERQQEIRKEVLTVLAQHLDNYPSLFPGPEKAEHRKEAREFLRDLSTQFSTLVYARSGGTEIAHLRPANLSQTGTTTAPQTETSRQTTRSKVTWASVVKGNDDATTTSQGRTNKSTTGQSNKKTLPTKPKPADTRILARLPAEKRLGRPEPKTQPGNNHGRQDDQHRLVD